jgi:hypothetical protein
MFNLKSLNVALVQIGWRERKRPVRRYIIAPKGQPSIQQAQQYL